LLLQHFRLAVLAVDLQPDAFAAQQLLVAFAAQQLQPLGDVHQMAAWRSTLPLCNMVLPVSAAS
jgi:hypothetical protein